MIYMCTADDTTGTFCFYTCSAGTCAYNHIHVFMWICHACRRLSSVLLVFNQVLRCIFRTEDGGQTFTEEKGLTLLQEREKKTHKNGWDEVKEKSPINSGNGTCGAGLCFPNIPADWGGWEKGCETVGEGWVYADGGGLRGNEWEQTEMEGVGGVKCREWDRLWRKHGEGEWARGVRLRFLISRWLHSEEHV